MALIEQEEAAKLIRGNKEYLTDCQWLKGYNKACEDNAQIVEQMKEWVIYCENCAHHDWVIVDGPYGLAQEIHWCNKFYDGLANKLAVLPDDFCSRGRRKGE